MSASKRSLATRGEEEGGVWRRQGETNGRVSKFPNMVDETGTARE